MIKTILLKSSKQFWMYHCAGVGFLFVLLCTLFYFSGSPEVLEFNIFASLIWCFGFTISVLILRAQYIQRQWSALKFPQLLKVAVIPILLLGLFTTVFMAGLSFPFYLSEVIEYLAKEEPELSKTAFSIKFVLRNWFNSSFHICAWFGAYLAITTSKRAMAAEISNLQLQTTLKEAQLTNLSNQLNPHFLFNALNNIRFMISESAEDAERMLISLSEVLRYGLQSSSRDVVPLLQEVEILRKYSELIQVQFEDKVDFKMDVPENLMQYSVPPMMLQMLLENAVKHGIEKLAHGGVIELQISEVGDSLSISMCNDVPVDSGRVAASMGIGLKNIRKRLALIFGPSSNLETSLIDNRYCVNARIPRRI